MLYSFRARLFLITASSFAAFAACSDDEGNPDDGGAGSHADAGAEHVGGAESHGGGAPHGGRDSHAEGTAECEVLGNLCHAGDDSPGPSPIGDCHDLGHAQVAAVCHAEFASCIAICVPNEGVGGANGAGPSPYCAALGELCKAADTDRGSPANLCFELGRVNDEDACELGFEQCAMQCLGTIGEPEPAGHGGAGGGGAGGAH